jgi:hypothetical protein
MELPALLSQKRDALVDQWLARTLQSYPEQASRFLGSDKDRFRNPVGHTLRKGLATLFDEVTGDMDEGGLRDALEAVVRLRAVQDFDASQALSFVFVLRELIDGVLGRCPEAERAPAAARLNARIDRMALVAFDLFVRCRESIYEIKAREASRRTYVPDRIAAARQDRQKDHSGTD